MKNLPLLSRKILGQPSYLLLAMAAAFLTALAAGGAWQAVRNSSNQLSEWLPADDLRVEDLRWFDSHFDGSRAIRISWDGCTLANTEQLQWLARKLVDEKSGNTRLFERVTTGPEVIAELRSPPISLSSEAAISRLEGTLVGPPLRGARASGAASGDRMTCLVAVLSPVAAEADGLREAAIDRIRQLAAEESHIEPASIAMVGAAVDAQAIEDESRWSLTALGSLVVGISLIAAYWRLREWQTAVVVVATGVSAALVSLGIVYYTGIVEVSAFGRTAPRLGTADALLLAMPAVAYSLAILAALRMAAYARDAQLDESEAATETAVRDGWPAWMLTSLMLAASLGVLCMSSLAPLRKLGFFTGLSAIAGAAMVLLVLPAFLHRFLARERSGRLPKRRQNSRLAAVLSAFSENSLRRPAATILAVLLVSVVASAGVLKLDVIPHLPPLAGARSKLHDDYGWFRRHLGEAIPLEVVLTVPHERSRSAADSAEQDGQQYRLTATERIALVRELHQRIKQIPELGGATSAATFAPVEPGEDGEDEILATIREQGYLASERLADAERLTGRDLWRVQIQTPATIGSSRQLAPRQILGRLRDAIEPVLMAYEQRDALVGRLHQRNQELAGAKIAILYRGDVKSSVPSGDSPEAILSDLLGRSGVAEGRTTFINVSELQSGGADQSGQPARAVEALSEHSAVVKASATVGADVEAILLGEGVNLVDLSDLPIVEESAAIPLAEVGGPRPIRAVYTGLPVVSDAATSNLLATLRQSVLIVAPALTLAMMLLAWNPVAGILSMAPIVLTVAIPLGVFGWLGARIDIGATLIASFALAVVLDGVVHFLAWFRRGVAAGLHRIEACRMAVARSTTALADATAVLGLGLVALGASGIASVQLLGLSSLAVMAVAVLAVLVLLPAIIASRVGWFFAPAPAAAVPESIEPPVLKVHVPPTAPATDLSSRTDIAASSLPPAPHRPRPTEPIEEREEAAEGAHSSIQARLRRLRRSAGD